MSFLYVGIVQRAFGIKGGLKIKLWNSNSQCLANGVRLSLLHDNGKRHTLTIREVHGNNSVVTEEISDRTSAETWAGAKIFVDRNYLPALEQDEFYLADLLGAKIQNLAGELLGEIVNFSDNQAQTLVELKCTSGNLVSIPFIKPLLIDVQVENQLVIMDPPIGLFELYAK